MKYVKVNELLDLDGEQNHGSALLFGNTKLQQLHP